MKHTLVVAITLIYVICLMTFAKIYISDVYYVKSQETAKELEFTKAIDLANKSIFYNPYEPRYRYGLAKILLASAIGETKEKEKGLKIQALDELKKAESLNPQNLVTLKNIVPIYYFLAIDLQSVKAVPDIDTYFIQTTRDYFAKIKTHNPNDVSIYVLVAKYEELLAEKEMLKQSKEKILELRPDLLEWYITIPE